MDAWRTPERILAAHLSDQHANAGRYRRSAGPPPGLPAPEQPEAAAVPAHQRLRFEDHRGLEQGREQAVKADEDQPVGAPQPDPPRRRSLQDEELLPQEEDLGLTSRVRSAQRCEHRAEVLENINHPGTRLADR
jgi:hypothetical protein